MALSCISITVFFVNCTTPAKKKPICAEMTINTQTDFELCLFTEDDDDGESEF